MARTTVSVDPEHHIPVPRHRLIDVLKSEAGDRVSSTDSLCRLLAALIHFEYRELIDELKQDYLRFDPSRPGRLNSMMGGEPSEEEYEKSERRFLKNFVKTLEKANFIPLDQQAIDVADAEDYLFSLPVEVNWRRFDSRLTDVLFEDGTYLDGISEPPEFAQHALLFRRGVGIDQYKGFLFFQKLDMVISKTLLWILQKVGDLLRRKKDEEPEPVVPPENVKTDDGGDSNSIHAGREIERLTLKPEDVNLRSFFKRTQLQEPTFSELVMVYRLLPDGKDRAATSIDRTIHIKTLVDIPMADLEVVFPEKRLSMKPVDLIKLITTTVTGVAIVTFKLMTALVINPYLLFILMGSLFAYVGRTVVGYRTSRARYEHLVTDALYAKSRDNGLGVVLFLVDCMEEQEWKEALLAWTMLDRNGPCDAEKLDKFCEAWLDETFNIKADFEVGDGLGKLLEFGLVSQNGELWSACDLDTALERLDTRWDNYFQFNGGSSSSGPESIGSSNPVVPVSTAAEPIAAGRIAAEPIDAEPIDAEPIDAGPIDAEPIDAEPIDAEPIDAGPIDAEPIDAEPIDAEPIDAG
ncbi:MAG: hypothetical protein CMJ69_18945, partial [Planctomycetaceae bacterium]|nr:hypothetical protein [Planctomycetaceae bacterium]